MSADQYYIEQDRGAPGDDGGLPTYDDLAAQNGPNSRFGRWRGWIEKRAAERYADITPEERQRRRERGWDLPERPQAEAPSQLPLHIQTQNLTISSPTESSNPDDASVHLPFVSQTVEPSHLRLNQFGSRFLPHATGQIHCILPLIADRLILIGHDEGFSVLDMFPQEWTENGGIAVKQPSEAQAYPIWRGETIYQMTILELEQTGEGTHQGVVLALVGPEPDSPSASHKDSDFRALRMYNLGSLTSLARWTVAQKGARPLDLHRPSHWQAQQPSPPRKHRPQGSIARSIKSLIGDSPSPCPHPEPPTSYHSMLSSPSSYNPSYATPPIHHRPASIALEHPVPVRHHSDDSTWDVVDDLPLRWATDFVPLASPGSRLSATSVIAYATWNDKNRRSTGGQLLAIATKNSILLYESPKGERAYRFMKDLYTPLQPKNIMFFDQLVQQEMHPGPSTSPGKHHRSGSNGASRPQVVINDQNDGTTINYGTHLALFVVFEKKASWIRVADSAVGEFELREDGGPSSTSSGQLSVRDSLANPTGSIRLRSRLSMVERESSAKWILPARCDLPVPSEVNQFASGIGLATKTVYVLTRGKRSHLLPCPLPTRSNAAPPLHVIYWRNTPRHVAVRICHPSRGGIAVAPRFSQQKPTLFQAIAYGEHGMEVYETTVLSLFIASSGPSKGKGRAVASPYDSIRAEEDLGGETGYLSHGGNWDRADELYGNAPPTMERQNSASSFSSLGSDAAAGVLRDEIGMYGWCRKGSGDYRIFWVGGSYGDVDEEAKDDDIY